MRTREQDRIYRAELRARKRSDAATVVPMPARLGKVEAAVQLELSGLAAAAERPGLTAIALRLGAILDDQGAIVHHPAAAKALDAVLERLHEASRGHAVGSKLRLIREARTTNDE